MAEKRSGAPISGEIITEGEPGAESFGRSRNVSSPAGDVVEAEYETLTAPREAEAAPSATEVLSGLEMLRSGGARRPSREPASSGGPVFWSLGLLAVAGAFWISGGHALLGQTASATEKNPAPSLRIAALESRIESSDGGALLLVDGEAVNEGGEARHLPALSINVLDTDGRTTHYLIGTNGKSLAAGERFAFSSRLAAPKVGVESVSVTFKEYSQ